MKTIKNVEEASEVIADLQKQLDEALEIVKAHENSESEKQLKDLRDRVTSLETQLEAVQADRDTKNEELTKVQASLDEKTKELDTLKTDQKNKERTARLEALKIKIDADRKESLMNMSDEAFDTLCVAIEANMGEKEQEDKTRGGQVQKIQKSDDQSDDEDEEGNLDTESGDNDDEQKSEDEVQASLTGNKDHPARLLVTAVRNRQRTATKTK